MPVRKIIESVFQSKGFLLSFLTLLFALFLFLATFVLLTVLEGFFAIFFTLVFFLAFSSFLLYVLRETKEKL